MLAMRFAPLAGGELPAPDWTPRLPLPGERNGWRIAVAPALAFWERAAADPRISAGFRHLGRRHFGTLRDLAARV